MLKKFSFYLMVVAIFAITSCTEYDAQTLKQMGDSCCIVENYTEAFKCYEESANKGNAYSARRIGELYEYGTGITKDSIKAIEWYQKAIELGDTIAIENLALCFYRGRDLDKVDEILEKAESLNYTHAYYRLGEAIFYDDKTKSIEYYEKGANLGCKDCANAVAYMYENAIGCMVNNYQKAVDYYSIAANLGHLDASNSLGLMYKEGKGVKVDYNKAIELFKLGADKEHLNSMINLGRMYKNGLGVKKDYVTAVNLYQKAAEKGSHYAIYLLAVAYYNGHGVPKDRNIAYTLFQKSDYDNPEILEKWDRLTRLTEDRFWWRGF